MHVLITGASRGVGYALTEFFAARRSDHIYILSRDQRKLERARDILERKYAGTSIIPLVYDLGMAGTDAAGIRERIAGYTGHLDILINNAGHLVNTPFAVTGTEEIGQSLAVNFTGPALLIQALLSLLGGRQASHVVNIGSMGGFQGSRKFPGLSFYSASKAALAALTECLAEEFAGRNIAINYLALGAVQTEMLAEAFPGYRAPVESGDMAAFIGRFALEAHRFINGKIIPVSLSDPQA